MKDLHYAQALIDGSIKLVQFHGRSARRCGDGYHVTIEHTHSGRRVRTMLPAHLLLLDARQKKLAGMHIEASV